LKRVFWLFLFFSLLSERANASVLSDAANTLAPGRWVQITTTGASVLKKPSNGDIAEYSNKAAYDPTSKRVLFCGASHHGSFFTDCVVYDLATNAWRSIGLPSGITAGPDDGSGYQSWIHGYDYNAIDQGRGIFYMRHFDKIYRYTIATNTWSVLPTMPPSSYNAVIGALEFFPETDRLVFLNGQSGNGHVYNPNTNSWATISSYSGWKPANAHSFFFRSSLGHLYTGAGNTAPQSFYRYNSDNTVTSLANLPVSGNNTEANVIGDPVSGIPLLFSINGNMYAYNPSSNTWSNTGAGSKLSSNADSSFIAPISDYGVIMLVKAGVAFSMPQVWLYRHTTGSGSRSSPPPSTADTTAPSIATDISASSFSSSQINLSWTASTDNVGVAGYKIYRGGVQIATADTTSYQNTGLSPSMSYSYTVSAYDAAGNESSQSATATATTQSATSSPPPSSTGQLPIPSLQDERDTYRSWGWTWNASAENPYPVATGAYTPGTPDIHGDLEADDLWTNLVQYRRTGQPGYLSRTNAWLAYFKSSAYTLYGAGGDQFGGDHAFGWGLIDYYLYSCTVSACDTAALTAAERIGAQVEAFWNPSHPEYYACLRSSGCSNSGVRRVGRHLLLITRLAEVTGSSRWATLRDLIFNNLNDRNESASYKNGWNATYGMFFASEPGTNEALADEAKNWGGPTDTYADGARIVSTFQIGILTEALWHYYRTTRNTLARQRIVDMAGFMNTYAMDAVNDLSCDLVGIVQGKPYCRYGKRNPINGWDPTYTISLVNLMVYRYKLTGETAYLDRAKHFFNRGTKAAYCTGVLGGRTSCTPNGNRETSDTTVAHFQDTTCGLSNQPCSVSANSRYFFFNKGELQYTYLIFENGGSPTVLGTGTGNPPAAPSGVTVTAK
jgi:hypothetical protein